MNIVYNSRSAPRKGKFKNWLRFSIKPLHIYIYWLNSILILMRHTPTIKFKSRFFIIYLVFFSPSQMLNSLDHLFAVQHSKYSKDYPVEFHNLLDPYSIFITLKLILNTLYVYLNVFVSNTRQSMKPKCQFSRRQLFYHPIVLDLVSLFKGSDIFTAD